MEQRGPGRVQRQIPGTFICVLCTWNGFHISSISRCPWWRTTPDHTHSTLGIQWTPLYSLVFCSDSVCPCYWVESRASVPNRNDQNWYVHCVHFVTGQLDKLIKYSRQLVQHQEHWMVADDSATIARNENATRQATSSLNPIGNFCPCKLQICQWNRMLWIQANLNTAMTRNFSLQFLVLLSGAPHHPVQCS